MIEKCLVCDSEIEYYYDLCEKCFEEMPVGEWVSSAVMRSDKLEEKDA